MNSDANLDLNVAFTFFLGDRLSGDGHEFVIDSWKSLIFLNSHEETEKRKKMVLKYSNVITCIINKFSSSTLPLRTIPIHQAKDSERCARVRFAK